MSKKTIFIGIISIFTLSFLVFPALAYGDQYYNQYSGNSFVPRFQHSVYFRSYDNGYMLQGGADDEYYMCPVNFNVPDGSVYFIKSIGIRYKDYIANGQIIVYLKRINLYTGNVHTVVSWDSGLAAHSSTILTASKGTETGYKLVDSKKFVYWLSVYFYVDGDVTPGSDLTLFQIRIHYGT